MRTPCSDRQGSILVWTVLIITILSILGAEVLRVVSIKHQSALQTATWQEASMRSSMTCSMGRSAGGRAGGSAATGNTKQAQPSTDKSQGVHFIRTSLAEAGC